MELVQSVKKGICLKRYQTLWRMYDQIIHDPELRKAADVIFVPEGPGHENKGLHYWGEQPKRRLTCSWVIMENIDRFY